MEGDRVVDEEAKRENDPVDAEKQKLSAEAPARSQDDKELVLPQGGMEFGSGDAARTSCDGPRKVRKRKSNESCSDKSKNRDAHHLLDYFKKMQEKNASFYHLIRLDDDNRVATAFWADARSRMAYNHFGDAVTFDTTYRSNQYKVPFVAFTGINHHGQKVLFGCGLLLDDSDSSLTWLLSAWLSAMNNRHPSTFTTDRDRAIQMAATQVFPGTRHCICKWHFLREGRTRLEHIHRSLVGDLGSCIRFTDTGESFESSWADIIKKYDLLSNEWFRDVHNARQQWAPVYFRDIFSADLSGDQGLSGFLEVYVDADTTIPQLMELYEYGLENSLEAEIKADNDTILPLIKTQSEMELQAANLYTKQVFLKFQEELVGSFECKAENIVGDEEFCQYRVANVKRNSPNQGYNRVAFDVSNMTVKCSCQMFESCGILCRHALNVFTLNNVTALPSRYILKRWGKTAKSWFGLEEHIADQHGMETLTSRFNSLCLEAIKYAEEGSVSIETYNAAISGLRQGAKTIAEVPPPIQKDDSISDDPQLYYFPSISWEIQNWTDGKVAVITLELKYSDGDKTALRFRTTTVTHLVRDLISKHQKFSTEAKGGVTFINWVIEDDVIGETQVVIQVSRDELHYMLRRLMIIDAHLSP